MSDRKDQRTASAKHEAAAIEANSNLPSLSSAEKEAAQKEGMKDAVKEAAADAYTYLTDGNLPGESQAPQYVGSDEIMQFAHLIDLSLDELERVIAPDAAYGIGEEKVAGLLKLERAGKNRTDYVKALCKRLGIKSPYEVTTAGPGYTNDTTNVTAL